jgi:hypothetical protein
MVFLGMALMAVTLSSCAKEPIVSWDSPRMIAAKQEWDSLRKNPPPEDGPGSSKNNKLIEMQQDLLKRTLSSDDMRRLAATCGTLPTNEKDPNAFEINVLQYIVAVSIEAGDRESLVTLLSNRFVEYIGPELTTTRYLLRCPAKALKDPILVLAEAYSRGKDPDVRRQIAQVVRRGFENSGIAAKDDDEFVANAMQWYKKNKSHLTLRSPALLGTSFFEDDRTPEK